MPTEKKASTKQYKVTRRSFINNRIYEEGDTVTLDAGVVTSGNLEEIVKAKAAAKPKA